MFEFLEFVKTPGEKYVGVAVIRAYGKIILRYKIVPKKDGNGFFPAPASVKIEEKYEQAFEIDSSYEDKKIREMVMENIKGIFPIDVKAGIKVSFVENVAYIETEKELPF